ncbi:MAG: VWA domain-containing protein [Deltaproteobacteria bacterium]|nr:MAG: VWA domain-containing protein [Deltaproteobacteria bacterium]
MSFKHRTNDHPSHRVGASLARALGLSLLVGGLAVGTGCDSTATLFPQKVNFQRAMIVSAYPGLKNADGSWKRQCGPGPVTGIITNVALLSTQRKTSTDSSETEDRDLSIRPGDVIDTRVVEGSLPDDINLTHEGHLDYTLDCLEPQPARATGSDCQARGGTVPSVQLDQVTYVDYAARRAGQDIMILIDQSGSTSGLVDATKNNIEAHTGNFEIPSNFGSLASDGTNLRLAAARRLIRTLNSEDRFGVLAFGEDINLKVPCQDAQGDVQTDLDLCFGARNTDIWLQGDKSLDSLAGTGQGRSNMWVAVDKAYEFLKNRTLTKEDKERGVHIVVLTDGPDTCSQSENRGACQAACSTTDEQTVLNKIETDFNDPNALKIHVHFIQFESRGYTGRDPRQLEVSCYSGGQYQYVNSNQFSSTNVTPLQEALETAVINVRYMLMGYWQLASEVPAYQNNAAAPTGTLPGSLYALSGLLKVKPSSNMVKTERPFPFDVGQGELADSATNWDRRPVVRKPCTAATDCGAAAGAGGACTIICSEETLTCPGTDPSAGITAPDTFSCVQPSGSDGSCCQGQCIGLGESCATCTQ